MVIPFHIPCPKCNYDLWGLNCGEPCPECGKVPEGILAPNRLHFVSTRGLYVLSMTLLICVVAELLMIVLQLGALLGLPGIRPTIFPMLCVELCCVLLGSQYKAFAFYTGEKLLAMIVLVGGSLFIVTAIIMKFATGIGASIDRSLLHVPYWIRQFALTLPTSSFYALTAIVVWRVPRQKCALVLALIACSSPLWVGWGLIAMELQRKWPTAINILNLLVIGALTIVRPIATGVGCVAIYRVLRWRRRHGELQDTEVSRNLADGA